MLNKEYKIRDEKLISPDMANFLYSCLRKNKQDRIKTEKLRSHPVFRGIEEKYN